MSASDRSTPPAQPTERLEVPTLPPPSSRFVLPPPPSALLSRLQAFLPQIRDANAALEPREGELEPQDEAVVMEEITDSSDSDDSSDDSSSSDSDGDSDDDVEGDARHVGGPGVASAEQDDAATGAQEERGTLAHLMDISARPAVTKKKLLVQEETAVGEAGPKGDEMQAD